MRLNTVENIPRKWVAAFTETHYHVGQLLVHGRSNQHELYMTHSVKAWLGCDPTSVSVPKIFSATHRFASAPLPATTRVFRESGGTPLRSRKCNCASYTRLPQLSKTQVESSKKPRTPVDARDSSLTHDPPENSASPLRNRDNHRLL